VLHVGWLSILDLLFVFSIGLFFGFVVLKTGSIMGVSISHGITNVVLFLVAPSMAVAQGL
jgi:membrane protease YdiL (CAAX protease family)